MIVSQDIQFQNKERGWAIYMEISFIGHDTMNYTVWIDKEEIGRIELYRNNFHKSNYYIAIDLKKYDENIANELFEKFIKKIKSSLQVMISSEERKIISFLEAGGFKCKRKCYGAEVTISDYIGDSNNKLKVYYCETQSDEYKICCKQLFQYYSLVHEKINPLSVSYEEFINKLPIQVFFNQQGNEIMHIAFVEENEIAYVCSKETDTFLEFINTVVLRLFEKYKSICFEYDDCDAVALKLATLFKIDNTDSYNTYVKEYK